MFDKGIRKEEKHLGNSPMRITNSIPNQQLDRPEEAQGNPAIGRPAQGNLPPESTTHAQAPEFLSLLDQLRQIPQLREEVVREVAQRLANGELSTPTAAERVVKPTLAGSAGRCT